MEGPFPPRPIKINFDVYASICKLIFSDYFTLLIILPCALAREYLHIDDLEDDFMYFEPVGCITNAILNGAIPSGISLEQYSDFRRFKYL